MRRSGTKKIRKKREKLLCRALRSEEKEDLAEAGGKEEVGGKTEDAKEEELSALRRKQVERLVFSVSTIAVWKQQYSIVEVCICAVKDLGTPIDEACLRGPSEERYVFLFRCPPPAKATQWDACHIPTATQSALGKLPS